MNTLVIYYSRSGKTRQAAEKVAEVLRARLEAIEDLDNRKGAWGFLKSGAEASRSLPANIAALNNDPAQYDLVVLCTPVWAGRMSSPMRTVLNQYGSKMRRTAYLITRAASGKEFREAFAGMTELVGKQPVAAQSFCSKAEDYLPKVEAFARELQGFQPG